MATTSDGIIYTMSNVLPSFNSWELTNAEISGGNIVIHPNGNAKVELSNSVNKGLKVSRYRQFTLRIIDDKININYNYQNLVEAVMDIEYIDEEKNRSREYQCIPFTLYDTTLVENNIIQLVRELTMINANLNYCSVKLANHTDHDITIVAAILYRSNELTGQVGDIINQYGDIINQYPDIGDDITNINNEIADIYQRLNELSLDVIIPLVTQLPDITTVQDGYICRLA